MDDKELRAEALRCAVRATEGDGSKVIVPEDIIKYAQQFENYLRGDIPSR